MFGSLVVRKTGKKSSQRGIALLICIFALLLVSGIALALLGSSDTETSVNQNYRETQVAYFAAQSGIAEAVSRMKLAPTASNAVVPPSIMPSTTTAGGVVYIVNKRSSTEQVQPWALGNTFQDTELCHENFPLLSGLINTGVGVPCASVPTGSTWYGTVQNSIAPLTNTSGALDYKWVRINLKGNGSAPPYYVNGSSATTTLGVQVCNAGASQALLPTGAASCTAAGMQPVYVLTALAVTPRGTRRMVQTEVSRQVGTLPTFPAAVTLDGPGSTLTPPFDAPNSNPFYIDGTDHGGCGGANQSAVGVINSTTQSLVVNAIPSNRLDHYIGVSGTTPDVDVLSVPPPTGSSPTPGTRPVLSPSLTSTTQIEALIASLTQAADPSNVYTGAQTDINIGSQSSPQLTVVNGDLTMTGATRGGGILLVTGTLTMSGNSGFYGVILVLGKGNFVGNGGGNGQYDGAVIVANTRDSNGNVLSSLGTPIMNWSGGGGNGFYYNTCAINSARNIFTGPFLRLATRELMY